VFDAVPGTPLVAIIAGPVVAPAVATATSEIALTARLVRWI
jgi:hypothetical protein